MTKSNYNIIYSTVALVLLIIWPTITTVLLLKELYLLSLLLFLSSVGTGYLIFRLYRGRKKLLNDFYLRLFSLIASLKLESRQDSISLQKKAWSVDDLEDTLLELERAIESKTDEYKIRNNQLRKNQSEILRQNKKLGAAYDALKESQERYEKLVNNLEEEYFFYERDIHGKMLSVSPSVRKILGVTSLEFKSKFHDFFTVNSINKHAKIKMGKSVLGVQQPRFLLELCNLECEQKILEVLEVPIFDKEEKCIGVEALAHNISEQYYAEELMREQEEKYRQVFNSASDFIFIYHINKDGSSGKFIEANDYTLAVLGYTQNELIQITPDELNAAEIWGSQYDRQVNGKYERVWESQEGVIINVEISEHYIKVNNKKACISVARDITTRKKDVEEIKFMNEELINQKENLEAMLDNLAQTQEQLVQSEKMAALGQLIAGVAHEVNTPLGAIKASVGNLSDSLESALSQLPVMFTAQSKLGLDLFLKTFERARIKKPDLTSREKREKRRAVRKELKEKGIEPSELLADILGYLEIYDDLGDIQELLKYEGALSILKNVRNFISLLKNTYTISIASEKASKVVFALKKYAHRDSLGEKVPTDIIDGIETVLTLYDNQLKQGIQVVKKFDKLPTVMCYQDEINQVWTNLIQNSIQAMNQQGTITIGAHADDKRFHVTISDTGEGIAPNILEKIFDPFFTTKKQGEGSGLGLDIVKKIIDKHSGEIKVKSEINEGTTFIVNIPLF